uniref:Uncharacterized protein n=1 Tax=Manihot esculenta TaxID=3983 RepID=A0A2C9W379_MANES
MKQMFSLGIFQHVEKVICSLCINSWGRSAGLWTCLFKYSSLVSNHENHRLLLQMGEQGNGKNF